MIRTATLLAALTASGAAAAPPPRQPQIANGVSDVQPPAVLALVNPLAGTHLCSAVLIDCDRVLTAAHCVCDDSLFDDEPGCQQPRSLDALAVVPQHDAPSAITGLRTGPDYQFGQRGDLALLRLATPISVVEPLPLSLRRPPPGSTGRVAGYGESGAGFGDFGIKLGGTIVTTGCDEVVDDEQFLCWKYRADAPTPGIDVNSCVGDSGAPLLIDDAVVALVAGGENDCDNDDLSYNTALATEANRDWLELEFGTPRGCPALPGRIGDADVSVRRIDGQIGADDEREFSVTVEPGATQLRVALNGAQKARDAFIVRNDMTLLLRHAATPVSDSDADCVADTPGNYEYCVIDHPDAGRWRGLVRNRRGQGGPFQITATVFYPAPDIFSDQFEHVR